MRNFDADERDAATEAMGDVREFRRTVEGYAPIPAMKGLLARKLGDLRWLNVRPPLMPTDPKTLESLRAAMTERFGLFRSAVLNT